MDLYVIVSICQWTCSKIFFEAFYKVGWRVKYTRKTDIFNCQIGLDEHSLCVK